MLPSAFVVPVEFVSIIQTYIAKAIALETECPPAMRQTLSGEQVIITFEGCERSLAGSPVPGSDGNTAVAGIDTPAPAPSHPSLETINAVFGL